MGNKAERCRGHRAVRVLPGTSCSPRCYDLGTRGVASRDSPFRRCTHSRPADSHVLPDAEGLQPPPAPAAGGCPPAPSPGRCPRPGGPRIPARPADTCDTQQRPTHPGGHSAGKTLSLLRAPKAPHAPWKPCGQPAAPAPSPSPLSTLTLRPGPPQASAKWAWPTPLPALVCSIASRSEFLASAPHTKNISRLSCF